MSVPPPVRVKRAYVVVSAAIAVASWALYAWHPSSQALLDAALLSLLAGVMFWRRKAYPKSL